jgi:hypothetical protein
MSIKSIFEKVISVFEKLFKETPKFEQAASAALTVIAPLVETILIVAGEEPLAAVIENVVSQIKTDLAAAAALVETSGATPTLSSVLQATLVNLKSLLTAGDIKDPATLQKVTAVVETIVAELQAIISAFPASVPKPVLVLPVSEVKA